MLVGRRDELRRIDELLGGARRGESGTLVLRGEAGIGKSTLLDYAAAAADDMRVLRTRGIESESELAFSGLLEALRPLVDDLPRLPQRQADAVRGALALEAEGDDPYAVYAGVLGLLSLAAERSPLLLLVDDAHWLDRGFLSRWRSRVDGSATRGSRRSGQCARASRQPSRSTGLPEVALDGLSTRPLSRARCGGGSRASHRMPRGGSSRVTGGNPLALVELPQALTSAQREGREPARRAPADEAQRCWQRSAGVSPELPAETRRLLRDRGRERLLPTLSRSSVRPQTGGVGADAPRGGRTCRPRPLSSTTASSFGTLSSEPRSMGGVGRRRASRSPPSARKEPEGRPVDRPPRVASGTRGRGSGRSCRRQNWRIWRLGPKAGAGRQQRAPTNKPLD